jgi:hypothetical protein
MSPKKTVNLHMTNNGTDEVNYGTEKFPVDPKTHNVEVPTEAVSSLVKQGGALVIEEKPLLPPQEGWVKIRHDNPNASMSFDGVSYCVGDDGCGYMPAHVATVAIESHGFKLI